MRKSPIILGAAALVAVGALAFGRTAPQGSGTNHPVCHWNEGTKQWNYLTLSIPGVTAHLTNHPLDFVPQGHDCSVSEVTTTVAETTTTAGTEGSTVPDTTVPVTTVPVETSTPQESTTTVGSTVPTSVSVPPAVESGTIPATE